MKSAQALNAWAYREEVIKKGEEPPGNVHSDHQREQHRAARSSTVASERFHRHIMNGIAGWKEERSSHSQYHAPSPEEAPRHPAGQHRVQCLPHKLPASQRLCLASRER